MGKWRKNGETFRGWFFIKKLLRLILAGFEDLDDLFEKPIQDFQFLGFHNIWSFTCGFNYNRNLFWLERSEE